MAIGLLLSKVVFNFYYFKEAQAGLHFLVLVKEGGVPDVSWALPFLRAVSDYPRYYMELLRYLVGNFMGMPRGLVFVFSREFTMELISFVFDIDVKRGDNFFFLPSVTVWGSSLVGAFSFTEVSVSRHALHVVGNELDGDRVVKVRAAIEGGGRRGRTWWGVLGGGIPIDEREWVVVFLVVFGSSTLRFF